MKFAHKKNTENDNKKKTANDRNVANMKGGES